MVNASLRSALRPISCLVLAIAVAGCVRQVPKTPIVNTPWDDAHQLMLVTIDDWDADHGELRTYERGDGAWEEVSEGVPVSIGRSGAAWGEGLQPAQAGGPIKKEGDGRSAAGVFRVGEAFGYAATSTTALPYRGLQVSDYCVDVDGSPLYNRIVDAREVGQQAVADSTEPMRRDLHADGDMRYKLGFVIEQNPNDKRGAGSCIFAHLWQMPMETTAGCTAMDEVEMQMLLAWLKPEENPIFILLPQKEYARLRKDWALP